MSKGHCVYSWLCFSEWCCWICGDYSTHLLTCLSSCVPHCVGKWEGPQIHYFTFFLLPPTYKQRGRWELCAAPPWHLMLCVASSPPCILVSLFAGPHCLFLNYCIWNQLPNHAAKNTPSNQIIMVWVHELFLYTVLIANKSLNPFRKLEKERQRNIISNT